MKSNSQRREQIRKDAARKKAGATWPIDVMMSAAAMVVDEQLGAQRVSRELGIPYTTLHEWVKKYRAGGAAALQASPGRGGKRSAQPNKDDPRRQAILAVKGSQPQAGSRRIRDVVKRFFGIGASETTVRRVLKEEGLAGRREAPAPKPRPKPNAKRFERAEPNQLWQSDLFTFLLRRHERVYVAAFMDDHSRYLVSLVMAHHQKSSLVMEALARGIADYGAPREILTDQGRQYTAWRGSTAFEEELKRNGIAHVKSRPHHPQTCGKIERFWKTLWEELLSRTVFADFDDCQRRAALFVQHYNFQRPHQALEGMTPADRFFRSAPQVRAAIESTVAANALRMAREQPPRKPFYLVGRLGDQDLSINASGAGLKVCVGGEETTIPLTKEAEHEEAASTSRWNAGRFSEEAPPPPGAEVAEGLGEAGRDREEPGAHGALGALGGEAGDRCDPAGEDLARHLLPDGDACLERNARGVEPDRDRGTGRDTGSLGDEDRGAAQPHPATGAGQAAHAAPLAAHEEVDPGAGDDGAAGPPAEECAPRLDPEWETSLASLEGEGDRGSAFDPDESWRERALAAERKLAGFMAAADASQREDRHGEVQEDIHAGTASAGADERAPGDDHGGARGAPLGRRGGANARDVEEPLPDDPAPWARRHGGIDHAAAFGQTGQAQGDARARSAGGEAEARECAPARAGGHDRALAAGGERSAAGAHSPGAPDAQEEDGGGRR